MTKLSDFITAENELDGQEHVYIAQGGKTRKTLLQKIKEFVIGTATMGTTATDITGAIAEHTSQMNEKVNKTQIVNNLLATEAGFVLDARQAKELKDYIDLQLKQYYSLNNAIYIPANTDLNDLTEYGNYVCPSASIGSTLLNTPVLLGGFTLKNERTTGDASGTYILQTIISMSGDVREYKRMRNNSSWGVWYKTTYTTV